MILTACFSSLYLFPLKVILEDLPDEFATALREYNRQVTDVFSQYLTAVAADFEKERGGENKLPLSGIGKKLPYHFIFDNFFLPMVVLLWVIGLFWQETKFSIRSMTSSFELQGSVFSGKQLFVFYGFDKNYTWHVLSVFFVCLFFGKLHWRVNFTQQQKGRLDVILAILFPDRRGQFLANFSFWAKKAFFLGLHNSVHIPIRSKSYIS